LLQPKTYKCEDPVQRPDAANIDAFSAHPFFRRIGTIWFLMAFVGLAVVAMATPSLAQDGGELFGCGGCAGCHGNLAQGGDDGAEEPGPDLRSSRLDRDLILETLSCGRPGTAMPFNLTGAYTEIECYGIPVGEVPPETNGGGGFTAAELEVLATFLMDHVVGVRRVTRQNCALFFGGNENARACLAF